MSLIFHFLSFWLALSLLCDVSCVTMNETFAWELIHPLLRSACHKAVITPVSTLRTKLIHISSSYWTIYRSFETILEWELSVALEFKFNANSLFRDSFQSDMHYIWKKYQRAARAPTDEPELKVSERIWENAYYEWYFLIHVTCKLNTKGPEVYPPKSFAKATFFALSEQRCLGHRLSKHKMTRYPRNLGSHGPLDPPRYACGKVRHKTKVYEHWQGLMKRARVNNIHQWSGWWYKYTKQAFLILFHMTQVGCWLLRCERATPIILFCFNAMHYLQTIR